MAKILRKAWRKASHFIRGSLIAVDTETTGLDFWHEDQPFAFSFCNEEGDKAYFEWPVCPINRKVEPIEKERKQLKDFFEDERITKVFFNAKFDIRMVLTHGIVVAGPGGPCKDGGAFHEVMFQSHIFNSEEEKGGLKPLAFKYCDVSTEDETYLKKAVQSMRRRATAKGWKIGYNLTYPLFPREGEKKKAVVEADYWMPRAFLKHDPAWLKSKFTDWKEVLQACKTYAELDAERTLLLHLFYNQGLEARGQTKFYHEELSLWKEVYRMEDRGVRIDRKRVTDEIEFYRKRAHHFREALRQEAKDPKFNPDSGQQCSNLLYKRLGIEPHRFNERIDAKSGEYVRNPSSDKEALVGLREHKAVNYLISYRTAKKAVTTTFGPWTRLWVKDSFSDCWSIHTDFQQCGPRTGRLASRRPNLQNVSNNLLSSSLEGVLARKPFGPRPGYLWFSMDYANLEVRIFAEVSQVPLLIKWFRERQDVHTRICEQIWGGDTERCVKNAVHSLDLLSNRPSTEPIAEFWEQQGFTEKNIHTVNLAVKMRVAHDWIKSYNFQIVPAEYSMKKKRTRNRTKQITFNKIFGGGADSLSTLMRCPYEEALEQIQIYNEEFPEIDRFIRKTIRDVRQNGRVYTVYGNRLEVDRNFPYKGVNYIVQGTAARLLKRSMVLCGEYLRETGLDATMVLTLHDELTFEFRIKHLLKPVIRHMIYLMEDPDEVFDLDMRVDPSIAVDNWEEKKDIPEYSSELPTKGSKERWTRQCLKHES